MDKTILTIGCKIVGNDQNHHLHFNSRRSLDDADIVLIEPHIPREEYHSDSEKGGKVSFGLDNSKKIAEDMNHWNHQLSSFLEGGGAVFSFLVKKEECILKLYDRFSMTSMTESIDANNYELLGLNFVDFFESLQFSKGNFVESTGHKIFSGFYEKFKGYLRFEAYLEPTPKNVSKIFTTRNKARAVGVFCGCFKGHVVFLPCLKDAFWKNSSIPLGEKLMECLIDIDRQLKGGAEKTNPPKWLVGEQFSTEKARSLEQEIKANKREVVRIQSENKKLKEKLDEKNIIKDLLFEKGKPLEKAVKKALNILGYTVEHYDDGNLEIDQIAVSPEGQRFIGESEGKDSKDVDITKYRQLRGNIDADFDRDEVDERAYGILFGNGQRLQKPDERGLGFTEKCTKDAKRERIALVRTMDLFEVAKYLQDSEHDEFKKECRDAIYERCDENGDGGGIVEFPPIPSSQSSP